MGGVEEKGVFYFISLSVLLFFSFSLSLFPLPNSTYNSCKMTFVFFACSSIPLHDKEKLKRKKSAERRRRVGGVGGKQQKRGVSRFFSKAKLFLPLSLSQFSLCRFHSIPFSPAHSDAHRLVVGLGHLGDDAVVGGHVCF